jgi:hypothetical protein
MSTHQFELSLPRRETDDVLAEMTDGKTLQQALAAHYIRQRERALPAQTSDPAESAPRLTLEDRCQ